MFSGSLLVMTAFLMVVQLQNAVGLDKVSLSKGCCYVEPQENVEEIITSPRPHEYLSASQLPKSFDWRNVNGSNYCSKVLTQMAPSVCGSCWAEAATGALSDRFTIATKGQLRINLAPQQLLNFNEKISGGSCNGGSDLKAYQFMHRYGITDDTCAPFMGLNWLRGFTVAAMTDVDDVRKHQCYLCTWQGSCTFVPRESYDIYGVEEFGTVRGVQEMKAEIFARGSIACLVNSDPPQFNLYSGGIITCDAQREKECIDTGTDHVVVIAGWGLDQRTGTEYWVGRNSYGTQWGEGAGGGWFRLALGKDVLNIESHRCTWAVPARADVERAMQQFEDSCASV